MAAKPPAWKAPTFLTTSSSSYAPIVAQPPTQSFAPSKAYVPTGASAPTHAHSHAHMQPFTSCTCHGAPCSHVIAYTDTR